MSAGYGSNVSYYSGGNGGAGIDGAGGQGANFYVGYYSYGGDTGESANLDAALVESLPTKSFSAAAAVVVAVATPNLQVLQLPLVAMVAPAVAVAVLATRCHWLVYQRRLRRNSWWWWWWLPIRPGPAMAETLEAVEA